MRKISSHFERGGYRNIDLSYIDKLSNYPKLLGKYEIIYNNDGRLSGFNQLSDNCEIKVVAGRYVISYPGHYLKETSGSLLSSQFIEFTLSEYREYKLNKILPDQNLKRFRLKN